MFVSRPNLYFDISPFEAIKKRLLMQLQIGMKLQLVTGKTGSGKTTLIQTVANNLDVSEWDCLYCLVSAETFETHSLTKRMMRFLDTNSDTNLKLNPKDLITRLEKIGKSKRKILVLIDLIDSFDNLSGLAAELMTLVDMSVRHNLPLYFIATEYLSADESTKNKTETPYGKLISKATYLCNIPEFKPEECSDYVEHCLTASHLQENLISNEIIQKIFEFADGNLKKAGMLLEALLIDCHLENDKRISLKNLNRIIVQKTNYTEIIENEEFEKESKYAKDISSANLKQHILTEDGENKQREQEKNLETSKKEDKTKRTEKIEGSNNTNTKPNYYNNTDSIGYTPPVDRNESRTVFQPHDTPSDQDGYKHIKQAQIPFHIALKNKKTTLENDNKNRESENSKASKQYINESENLKKDETGSTNTTSRELDYNSAPTPKTQSWTKPNRNNDKDQNNDQNREKDKEITLSILANLSGKATINHSNELTSSDDSPTSHGNKESVSKDQKTAHSPHDKPETKHISNQKRNKNNERKTKQKTEWTIPRISLAQLTKKL